MIIVGLTGGIGMGKSTVSRMFSQQGIPVWDADATVHTLYAAGGAAVPLLAEHFPDTIVEGAVDRSRLAPIAFAGGMLSLIESLVDPLIEQNRTSFIKHHRNVGTPMVLLDVPLLFERNLAKHCDQVITVSCPREVQKERVMARPGMTEEKFQEFRSRQMPDSSKCLLADHVIDTSQSLEHVQDRVETLIVELSQ